MIDRSDGTVEAVVKGAEVGGGLGLSNGLEVGGKGGKDFPR
jgi:hypothetical protein